MYKSQHSSFCRSIIITQLDIYVDSLYIRFFGTFEGLQLFSYIPNHTQKVIIRGFDTVRKKKKENINKRLLICYMKIVLLLKCYYWRGLSVFSLFVVNTDWFMSSCSTILCISVVGLWGCGGGGSGSGPKISLRRQVFDPVMSRARLNEELRLNNNNPRIKLSKITKYTRRYRIHDLSVISY